MFGFHRRLAVTAAPFIFTLLLLNTLLGSAAPAHTPRYEAAPCPAKLPGFAGARCGFLVVPENRRRRDSPSIKIAVAVLPSRTVPAKSDPLVYLEGGPGGIAFLEAKKLLAAGFNRVRDLVLVEQRGELYSVPTLTCPVIDEFNKRLIGLRYDSESTRRLHVAATAACRRQLLHKGVELAAYNTTENAADFADLRRVLGYRDYDVFGVSYGTDLAQVLMRDHPRGIRSVVLDSTVPTNLVTLSSFWPNARAGIDNLATACRAQMACTRFYPKIDATFTNLVPRLESTPVVISVTTIQQKKPVRVVLDGGALVNWLVNMSFFTPQLVDVPAWIAQLASGKPTNIAGSRALVTPPGYVSYGLTYGVACREWVPFDSERNTISTGHAVFPGYPLPVVAQAPQFPFGFDDCRVWNVKPAPPAFRAPVVSPIPTLLFSGSFDQVTSLQWSQTVAQHLPHSHIVVIPGAGHFVLPESACAQAIMASFLDRPAAPDTSCAATLEPRKYLTP